ncbi:hypothetical protein BDP27DRAFT_1206185, partial [Rhodocollybia butyracea]
FDCQSCKKNFDRKTDLKRHQLIHAGEKPHACSWPGCERTFAQSSGLNTHMNTHTRNRPHLCKIPGCAAKFGDPSSRSRHVKEVHMPELGTFQCPFSGCPSTSVIFSSSSMPKSSCFVASSALGRLKATYELNTR